MLWPRKGSLMKRQTRMLDNRLYYTRKIELHRKGKKSRTVQIAPILICGICCSPHLTGKCGPRPFLGGSGRRAGGHTRPAFPKFLRPRQHSHYQGRLRHRAMTPPERGKSRRGRPLETEGNLPVPRHTRPDPCRR